MIKRADANQEQIVRALRKMGMTVQHLHTVGKGCPDILVGYRRRNYLFEIKDPDKSPSKRRLTPDEVTWIAAWRGQVSVIMCLEDALQTMIDNEQHLENERPENDTDK